MPGKKVTPVKYKTVNRNGVTYNVYVIPKSKRKVRNRRGSK